MTSDGTATWTYGGNNRPQQVTAAGITTQFSINALGQRVRKASATTGARFVYDEAGRLWGEYSDTGALVSETIWLDELPIAVVKAQPAAPVEQVIDNVSSGFAATGTWTPSTATPGYLGANYLVHNPGADALGAVIVDNADAGFTSTGGWTLSTAAPGYLGANYRVHAANGPPPTAVVSDNTDASVTSVGTWPLSTSVGGYVGANYQTHAGGTGANTFTWNVPVAQAGTYEVYARWTAHPNRASNASYTIATASGHETVGVNQQSGNGAWNRLGTWSFAAGSAAITLGDQANGYVIADAVMLVPPGAPASTATWSATLPAAGHWRVYARWAQHPNRATNAAFTVQAASGAVSVLVNQQSGGASWQLLGSYAFEAGSASVSVTDAADGFVVADAVKFEREGAIAESVTWTPALTSPARFEVYARWTAHANRSASAAYTITHQGGAAVVTRDQRTDGAAWNLLGTFTFGAGQGVRLAGSDGGYVVADAVKFTPAAEQPTTGGLFYVHADHLGTPRMITRPSDNAVVWRWDNAEPFGNSPAEEDPSGLGVFAYNLRFPGQYFDSETGTHYNYFRDYDPSIGRYVQSDPIGLKGGINTYAYVRGNPLALVDPSGESYCALPVSWGIEVCTWSAVRSKGNLCAYDCPSGIPLIVVKSNPFMPCPLVWVRTGK